MNKTMPDTITVTVLGSGSCVPSLYRSACAVLMETGGKRLLFDIGPGTMHRLLSAGVGIFDIDCLFISHFHPDHTGELVSFLFATKYPEPRARQRPLTINGGPGFAAFYNQLNTVFQHWIDLPGRLRILETGPDFEQQALDGFTWTAAPVDHRPESMAYRIDTPGGFSAVYSGDTDYAENLIRLAENTDLLICESALPDGDKVDGHMTPSMAGRMAAAAGVKQLMLTHFYPECDDADISGQCRKTYDGPLRLARDLISFDVTEIP